MTPDQELDLRRQHEAVNWHLLPHNGRAHHIGATAADLRRRARRRQARMVLRVIAQTWRWGR